MKALYQFLIILAVLAVTTMAGCAQKEPVFVKGVNGDVVRLEDVVRFEWDKGTNNVRYPSLSRPEGYKLVGVNDFSLGFVADPKEIKKINQYLEK